MYLTSAVECTLARTEADPVNLTGTIIHQKRQ